MKVKSLRLILLVLIHLLIIKPMSNVEINDLLNDDKTLLIKFEIGKALKQKLILDYYLKFASSMYIQSESNIIQVDPPTEEYSFESSGEFTVIIKFKDYLTDMRMMFMQAYNIKEIDFSYLNTKNVKDMSFLFTSLDKLTKINFTNFDTSNVSTMQALFSGCKSLTSLDLSSFDTKKVWNMGGFFNGCTKLSSVKIDKKKFITDNVIYFYTMFGHCSFEFDFSALNTENGEDFKQMFLVSSMKNLDLSNFDTSSANNMEGMFQSSLYSSLDLSSFNTKMVKSMVKMFDNCANLISLDLSNFKTLRVENFDSMFNGCTSLTSLDLTNFNLVRAVRLDGMFSNCRSLVNLDISTFDTSNVQYMNSMFKGCVSLTSIDLSHFNTGRVYSFSHMFESCTSLERINLTNFVISQTSYMSYMFQNCRKLISIDFGKFKSGKNNLFGINDMFHNCSSLSMINITNFNLTQFKSDYNEFDFSNLFTGVNPNGVLIYTEDLIPTKIQNIFPIGWEIIKS